MIQDIIVYMILLIVATKLIVDAIRFFSKKSNNKEFICKGCTSCSPVKIIPDK